MKSRIIYRLQHVKTGQGPYHAPLATTDPLAQAFFNMEFLHHFYELANEDVPGFRKGMLIGVCVPAHLVAWFGVDVLRSAQAHGFDIMELEVEETCVAEGKQQVAFEERGIKKSSPVRNLDDFLTKAEEWFHNHILNA